MSKRQRLVQVLMSVLFTCLLVASFHKPVSAHHAQYEAQVECGIPDVSTPWNAHAEYVGGDQRRLVLISNVTINGVPYDPSWSDAPNAHTNGVVPRSSYGGSQTGLPADTGHDFIWDGTSGGWTVFSRSGDNFVSGSGNWSGTITLYQGSGSWQKANDVDVYEPTPPSDCAQPGADVINDCSEDGLVVVLTNDGGGTAHFLVTVNDETPKQYEVNPHDLRKVPVKADEDTSVTIRVQADYGFDKTFKETRDCQAPPARPTSSVSKVCAIDGFVLTLSNKEGGTEFMFHVSFNNSKPQDFLVPAGEEQQVVIPAQEDKQMVVSVFGEGYSKTFTMIKNCTGSKFELTYYCGLGDYAIGVFYNTSDYQQTHVVKVNGKDADSVIVPPHGEVHVNYPIEEGQSLNIKVVVDGKLIGDLTVTRNCAGSGFDLTFHCGDQMASAIFTNTSDVEQTFVFTSNAMAVTEVKVAAHSTVTEPVQLEEDHTVTATVTVEGQSFSKTVSVSRDCAPNPGVQVVAECKVSEKNFSVDLINDGGGQVVFTIIWDGGTTTSAPVPAHDALHLKFPLPEKVDQTKKLTIEAPGMVTYEQAISGCGQPTKLDPTGQPPHSILLLPYAAH